MSDMNQRSTPVARPVPADAVVESAAASPGSWARGLLWMFGAWALTAVVWWITGAEVFYSAVVAMTALGAVGEGSVTVKSASKYLAITAGVALAGVLLLGWTGVELSAGQRLLQGAGGVAAAALILLATVLVHRRNR